jgi:hypothetical protein
MSRSAVTPFPQTCRNAGNAMIGQDQVRLESSLFGLMLLVLQGLV